MFFPPRHAQGRTSLGTTRPRCALVVCACEIEKECALNLQSSWLIFDMIMYIYKNVLTWTVVVDSRVGFDYVPIWRDSSLLLCC